MIFYSDFMRSEAKTWDFSLKSKKKNKIYSFNVLTFNINSSFFFALSTKTKKKSTCFSTEWSFGRRVVSLWGYFFCCLILTLTQCVCDISVTFERSTVALDFRCVVGQSDFFSTFSFRGEQTCRKWFENYRNYLKWSLTKRIYEIKRARWFWDVYSCFIHLYQNKRNIIFCGISFKHRS